MQPVFIIIISIYLQFSPLLSQFLANLLEMLIVDREIFAWMAIVFPWLCIPDSLAGLVLHVYYVILLSQQVIIELDQGLNSSLNEVKNLPVSCAEGSAHQCFSFNRLAAIIECVALIKKKAGKSIATTVSTMRYQWQQ